MNGLSELVTSENATKEMLKSLFDAAFMETSFDSDGDLIVRDGGVRGFVILQDENRIIRLMIGYRVKPSAKRIDLLEFLNRVNAEYLIIRAALANNNHSVCFDFYIHLVGGVSRANIVQTIKRVLRIVPQAVNEYGRDIFE
ncbi:MAG: YbjN domain-containing protein [Candidatus Sungbacteria bacterium]|uniref:YbjN domain-containing protein n=1 Tax=Candidatus Sungiibacteriota bacterium TaxID=2750080 RepID=A0A931YDB9_9BACT|nr:YbjN domain-containing protein [Candidatus Sungbacteria bacterium]